MTSASPPDSATARWYEDKVRRFGFDHRGLGFRSRSSQEKRFQALLALGDFDGRRLLDVGCGFGDFLQFLWDRGIQPDYTGLDICEPMVSRCRHRFAGTGARFAAADVLEHEPAARYDFVVASGIFGLDSPGVRERIGPTLGRLNSWADAGCAVNFLSSRSTVQAEARVYVDPREVLEFAFALTPAVRLDHGYLPNDFTLYLYPQPAWAAEKARTHETGL